MAALNGLMLFVLVLATFRLTRLVVFDKITEFLRRPFHEVTEEMTEDGAIVEYVVVKGSGLQKFIGELLNCYWCTGIWCAIVLYCGYLFIPHIAAPCIIILAVAGGAAFLEAILEKILED